MSKAELEWQEDLFFVGNTPSGHTVNLEASPVAGGKGRGAMPGEMLMLALGGCTSMDIVSLLKKFNAPPDRFRIELTGERENEHPKYFCCITVIYHLEGQISPEQAWKAVRSSYNKYSVVANSLRSKIDYRVIVNNTEVTGEK
jgi:putative redox protein